MDVPAAITRAHDMTREVVDRLVGMMGRTPFTARVRGRFLDEFPEGSSAACAA